ncbi:MAG: hypothetical protein WC619_00900 [Patescibacteria group bacterium]
MENIVIWLIELLSPFQRPYILVRKNLLQGTFTFFEIQSVPLSDTEGMKVLGWKITKREDRRYLAERLSGSFQIEVWEELPFMCPKLFSIFIISQGRLFEYITMKKN